MKQASKYSPKRLAWLGLGLVCVGLGAIGAVLPLMPTTIFLIIAAFAFARSSDRLHKWLMNHKVFGKIIQNWQEHGAISRAAKRASLISMIAIVLLSWALHAPLYIIIIQIIILGAVAAFIITRPLPPQF